MVNYFHKKYSTKIFNRVVKTGIPQILGVIEICSKNLKKNFMILQDFLTSRYLLRLNFHQLDF